MKGESFTATFSNVAQRTRFAQQFSYGLSIVLFLGKVASHAVAVSLILCCPEEEFTQYLVAGVVILKLRHSNFFKIHRVVEC